MPERRQSILAKQQLSEVRVLNYSSNGMPVSLPVIGHSENSKRIIFAFGHQHIGLTLGGVTGKVVTDLALKRTPDCSINDFDPKRF
jgi:glycine/D-amino acid oxidase-like deaminating enzyme